MMLFSTQPISGSQVFKTELINIKLRILYIIDMYVYT